jgi:O-antigen/teichoic acid export membrane protein
MNLAARIGRALFWSQAGRVAEVLIFLLFSLLLARVLGPSSFGLYALGVSVAGVCGFAVFLGLGSETLGRFLPELRARGELGSSHRLLGGIIAVRAGAIAALCLLALAFRSEWTEWIHFPAASAFLALVLLLFAARSVKDLLTCFSSGLLEFRRVAFANLIAAPIAPGAFLLFIVARRASVQTAWLSMIASAVCAIFILAVPIFHIPAKPDRRTQLPFARILRFGIFAWAANFFVYILGDNMDVLLLGWLRRDRATIGYYAVGARIVFSLTGLLLGWVSAASVATFSEALQQGGIGKLIQAVEAQWKLGILCLIAPLSLLIRYAREIVAIFYSAAYAPSVPVIEILSALTICAAVCGSSVQAGVLYTLNHERVACAVVGGAAVFNISSEVFLVRSFGINGAALATGLSFFLLAVLCAVVGAVHVPVRVPLAFIAKIAAAALLAVASTLWLHPASFVELAASCAVYGAAFVAGLAVLKPLTEQDSAALQQFHGRLGGWAERLFTPVGVSSGGR